MRKLLLCGLALGGWACDESVPRTACVDAPCPRISDAPYVRTTEGGVERFWRQANRNCVTVHPVRSQTIGDAAMDQAIQRAAGAWSMAAMECQAAMCVRIGERINERFEPGNDGRNLIGVVDDPEIWAALEDTTPMILAITISQLNARTGELVGADIAINEAHHVFSQRREGPRSGESDLESVILHEMGHLLGFDHPADDVPSVMRANLNVGIAQRALTSVDKTGVCETFARPPSAANHRRGGGSDQPASLEDE